MAAVNEALRSQLDAVRRTNQENAVEAERAVGALQDALGAARAEASALRSSAGSVAASAETKELRARLQEEQIKRQQAEAAANHCIEGGGAAGN